MSGNDTDTEYQLLPLKELENLKTEIQQLKSKSYGEGEGGKLISSINNLKDSVDRLNKLFDQVNKDIMRDFETKDRPEDLLKKLIDQNKTVATVLLNLSGKIDESLEKKTQENTQTNPEQADISQNPNQEQKISEEDDLQKSEERLKNSIPKPDNAKESKAFIKNPFKK